MAIDVDATALIGHPAQGTGGEALGTVTEVYTTIGTTEPRWAGVDLGDGSSTALVPLATARFDGDTLHLPYPRPLVQGSPRVGGGGHVSGNHEAELAAHYDVEYRTSESETGFPTIGLPPAADPETRP